MVPKIMFFFGLQALYMAVNHRLHVKALCRSPEMVSLSTFSKCCW